MAKLFMSDIEKGYVCPDFEDCTKCQFFKTLCVVYGKEGKNNFKSWLKRYNINPNTFEPIDKDFYYDN